MAFSKQSSNHRLTTDDIDLFNKHAESMMRHAEWGAVTRTCDAEAEYFEVRPRDEAQPMFSVGRCASGHYVFLNHRTGDVRFAGRLSDLLVIMNGLAR